MMFSLVKMLWISGCMWGCNRFLGCVGVFVSLGRMSCVAEPMLMPHLMIRSPWLMFCVAILWPRGMSCCRLKVFLSAWTVESLGSAVLAIPILSLSERIRREFGVILLSIMSPWGCLLFGYVLIV